MDVTEQHLRDYKMQYLGELPEQEQSNLQILSGLESQLNGASAELDRLQQDKTYLESMQAGYRTLAPAASSQTGNSQPGELAELRAKLADLQAKYTDRYPEVIRDQGGDRSFAGGSKATEGARTMLPPIRRERKRQA